MKLLWVIGLMLTFEVNAGLKLVDNTIMPFENKAYLVKDMIQDYADLMGLSVSYKKSVINEKAVVHLLLNSKTSKEDYKKIFYVLLDSHNYTPVEENGFLWITDTRDSRYLATKVYMDRTFPKDVSYKTIIYTLKYPVANNVARNLRPYLSRYGRTINFSDGKTMMFLEKGDNAERVLQLAEEMDTEVAYKNILAEKPKPKEEDLSLKEKIVELEVDKKILEKKMMDLKGDKNE